MTDRNSPIGGAVVIALAATLFGPGCADEVKPTPPTERHYTKKPDPPVADAVVAPLPRFEDAAAEAGVAFTHENGARGDKFLPETLGSGVAVLDADGDGHMDLLFVNARPWPWQEGAGVPPRGVTFLRNRGDGTFEDRTVEAGLEAPRYGMGVTVADYDGDGDTDVFLTAVGDCALYRNEGGRFTEVAQAAGVAGEGWTDAANVEHDAVWTAAAFLDYDGDGVLDLYVCRYVRWHRGNDVFTSIDGRTKAYTVPDRYKGDSGRLYRGKGDGTFEDVTDRSGVRNDDAKALGVAAADIDGDGLTDLVIANDTQPNHLFRNRGDGTFEEIGLRVGMAYDAMGRARADMGIDVAQIHDDGAPSIVTGTFSNESLAFYIRPAGAKGFTFVDAASAAGLAAPSFPSLTFGVLFQDFDLDGRLDLFIANGHIEPEIQSVHRDTPYAQRAQFFRNLGAGRFRDVSAEAGPALATPCVGRGLAWGDFDGDGDADLVLTTNGGPARLLRTAAPAGRKSLRIRLRGAGKNTDALGAVVAVTTATGTLKRERSGGGSYLSASEPTLLFGLGDSAEAQKVSVRWPGKEGATEDLGALKAGLWRVSPGVKPERLGD